MRNKMDYIYTSGEQKILIEVEQRSTRKSVVEQYVQCRKMQGLTQAELAKKAGIPRSNITRFESGNYNPSLELLVRIAAALGLSLIHISEPTGDDVTDAAGRKGMKKHESVCLTSAAVGLGRNIC